MAGYERQIAMAKRLIAKKGQLVTWSKNVTVQDTTKPWKTTAGVPVTFAVSMVFLTPKGSLNELVHLLAGSSVSQGAPNALMAAVPFTPEIGDSVLTSLDTFVIKAFDIVAPNGDPILYKLKFA